MTEDHPQGYEWADSYDDANKGEAFGRHDVSLVMSVAAATKYTIAVSRRRDNNGRGLAKGGLNLHRGIAVKRVNGVVIVGALILGCGVCSTGCGVRAHRHQLPPSEFEQSVAELKSAFPLLFLADAAIQERDDIVKPTVWGEPDPPEGFAGPDPDGRLPFGIYVPASRDGTFATDISMEQWILHEMFHLANRRAHAYDTHIDEAFPTDDDPLVQWLMEDPYHRTFAREEAFLNLVTFADPTRTDGQRHAVRAWYDAIGGSALSIDEIRNVLRVIPHPPRAE